jgi:hypothetical protein
MNRKTLFEIALKIVGLLALWNFLQSLGGIAGVFGILKMFASGGGLQNEFMGFIAINMLGTMVIPGIIAFYCLYRTERVIYMFKLDVSGSERLSLNPRVVYHMFILASALVIFMHGCANFMVVSYNRDIRTESNMNNGVVNNASFVNEKETSTVNYLAFAEIAIGILVLVKSAEITEWLFRRYGHTVSKDEERAIL